MQPLIYFFGYNASRLDHLAALLHNNDMEFDSVVCQTFIDGNRLINENLPDIIIVDNYLIDCTGMPTNQRELIGRAKALGFSGPIIACCDYTGPNETLISQGSTHRADERVKHRRWDYQHTIDEIVAGIKEIIESIPEKEIPTQRR